MRNLLRRHAPDEVIDGLHALLRERAGTPASRYVSDMLMYAEIGRDRRKLTMEYVDRVREGIAEQKRRFANVDAILAEVNRV